MATGELIKAASIPTSAIVPCPLEGSNVVRIGKTCSACEHFGGFIKLAAYIEQEAANPDAEPAPMHVSHRHICNHPRVRQFALIAGE